MTYRSILVSVSLCALISCSPPGDPVASVLLAPTSMQLEYSEVRPVEIEFHVLAALGLDAKPRVFVHLYDEPGNVVRTFDYPFGDPWQPGARAMHSIRIHQSALGPPLRPGRYALSVGLYDLSGRRWPLSVSGEEIDEGEYAVAEITVSESSDVPRFRFSEGWKPIEAGFDRQILGRRWLGEEGSIWITEAGSVDSIWMTLQVPNGGTGAARVMLEDGGDEPRVEVVSRCGGARVDLAGAGNHEFDITVDGGEAGESGECEVHLRPNYYLLHNGDADRRSVLLEALAWSRGG